MVSKQDISFIAEVLKNNRRKIKKFQLVAWECVEKPLTAQNIKDRFGFNDISDTKKLLNKAVKEEWLNSDTKDGKRYWYMPTNYLKQKLTSFFVFKEFRNVDKKQVKILIDFMFKTDENRARHIIHNALSSIR